MRKLGVVAGVPLCRSLWGARVVVHCDLWQVTIRSVRGARGVKSGEIPSTQSRDISSPNGGGKFKSNTR